MHFPLFQPSRSRLSCQPMIALTGITLSVLLTSLLAAPAALAQTEPVNTLTVTGQGSENIATSLAQVTLGVEVQGKTAQEVQQEVARRSTAVVGLLRSRNVEKLETTGINLNPNYSYADNKQQLIGYSGNNTVSFRVATDRAGAIMDEAVKAGASQINGVSFIAAPEVISAARSQALREATLDAQTQAKAVLDTLNLSPKQVVKIQVNSTNTPPPRPMMMKADAMRQESTPVVGGEQQVEASVTLEIQYSSN
jgi:uncharacterized protein